MRFRPSIRARIFVAVACAALALPVSAAHADDDPHMGVCGGRAPDVTSCTTGTHATTGLLLSIGAHALPGFVGEVESRFDWTTAAASGVRILHCRYTEDVFAQDPLLGECEGSGTWPAQGEPASVTHTCQTFALGSTARGGAGEWGCRIVHD